MASPSKSPALPSFMEVIYNFDYVRAGQDFKSEKIVMMHPHMGYIEFISKESNLTPKEVLTLFQCVQGDIAHFESKKNHPPDKADPDQFTYACNCALAEDQLLLEKLRQKLGIKN